MHVHILVAAPLMALLAFTPSPELWHPVLDPPLRLSRAFDVKHSEYEAGHRGVDLRAAQGQSVYAPADGTVTFDGTVVDRGVLTLALANGSLVSLEPVASGLELGASVSTGDSIATVSGASHCKTTCLHVGLRVDKRYVNPIRSLLGEKRPRLLPLQGAN